jgi:SAM-dependent methyltransferase
MPESDEFWDFYWDIRLQEIDDLGKKEAILVVSKLIRRLAEHPNQPVRLLELGCGEGQIIGPLVEAHTQVHSIHSSCGVDYSHRSIEKCRRAYPAMAFIEGDFTDPARMAGLGHYEIVLLVNALHEVFSAGYSAEIGEVAVQEAKQQVEKALAIAVERLSPGGYLVLFDGLEPPGDIQGAVRIRFLDWQARRRFDAFVHEYHPFRISYWQSGDPFLVELSVRDFTRYITKSIFLGKQLWQAERLESYQYFKESEFRAAFARLGLVISEVRTLTVNDEKWRSEVEIVTPGVDFPAEHILILAQVPRGSG